MITKTFKTAKERIDLVNEYQALGYSEIENSATQIKFAKPNEIGYPQPSISNEKQQRTKKLNSKLQDNSITFEELKELMRGQ